MAEREGCQYRSFSLLLKPCISSDPCRHFSTPSPLFRPPPPSLPTSISSLPDDLLLEILSRASLPSLPLVCRRFRHLLNSDSFTSLRRRHGLLNESLLAISISSDSGRTSIYCAKLASFDSSSNFEISTFPFSAPSGSFSHAQAASIGRWVYIIGRGATLRFDAWTGSVAIRAATLFPRKKFALAAINGKIYVAGGSSRTSAIEEYDPETDTWRVIATAPYKRYGCVGASANGIFFIAGGLKLENNSQNTLSAHPCASSISSYSKLPGGGWTAGPTYNKLPGGGCIVCLCSIKDSLYILASQALEISFWKWTGGKWGRLQPPPVTSGPGLAVRVSCEAVGDGKVVALVHVRTRRGRRGDDVAADVAVLVYDLATGEWTRGPGLSGGAPNGGCVSVEC